MKAARCRIAEAGDWVKGWKRLLGFSNVRSGDRWLDVADDALDLSEVRLYDSFCVCGLCSAFFACPCRFLDDKLREPKLRTEAGHVRLETGSLGSIDAREVDPMAPRWSACRQRPQVYSPAMVCCLRGEDRRRAVECKRHEHGEATPAARSSPGARDSTGRLGILELGTLSSVFISPYRERWIPIYNAGHSIGSEQQSFAPRRLNQWAKIGVKGGKEIQQAA